ncbi:unnamed protein product [Leptosia nina]|uniref:ascorbate ferrireductase (transmembrane) n=1 Tax=Leptosia nina TaxID=320188 RepID=A0AAV1JQ57_9NEOP
MICALAFIRGFYASTSFIQHVYLCVIGYVLIMPQAVHLLNPQAGWARKVKYEQRKMIHWCLQIVGTILVSIGSVIRMMDVTSNFASVHGILGILAFLCTIINMFGGIVHANSSRLNLNITFVKITHSFLGYRFSNIAIGFTVIGLVGTLVSPCVHVVKRLKLIK